MARIAHSTDFSVPVDGIGTFIFGRRKMADQMKIHVEYSRIIEGVKPTDWLDSVATWMSTLRVMLVLSPPEFDLEELDPLEDESFEKLLLVHAALLAKERSFRPGSSKTGEAAGEAAGGDDRVLVSEKVRPDAE